jgi:hypothetical protein
VEINVNSIDDRIEERAVRFGENDPRGTRRRRLRNISVATEKATQAEKN